MNWRQATLGQLYEIAYNDTEAPLQHKRWPRWKRSGGGLSTLYGWLEDERERPDMVAFRADRKPWLVTMTLETFLKLIGREEE